MLSAYTRPVLVGPSGGKEALLERIPLSGPESKAAYDEDWLQKLLYRHPAALPVAEIDDSFAGMVPVCCEMNTPVGPIDVVYVTRDGRPVIVEAKLWRNPEARRKVIGQILDYAKELSRWDFGALDTAVRRARAKEDHGVPKGLLELVGIGPNSPEASAFHDSVSRSLRRGDLLLLIVGDGIREGVGAITDFLEGQGSLHFTFGLVEMAIYRTPDGGQLVQPRVLAQSTIVRRIVVELKGDSLQAVEDGSVEMPETGDPETSPELVEARKRFQSFWTGFFEKLRLDDKGQEIPKPAMAQNQFFKMPKESTAWVSAFVSPSRRRAGVYLTFAKGTIGDRIYAALRAQRSAIEDALGISGVEWESDAGRHAIVSRRTYPGELLQDHAEEAQRTLAEWTNRYVTVFRPRLEMLSRDLE